MVTRFCDSDYDYDNYRGPAPLWLNADCAGPFAHGREFFTLHIKECVRHRQARTLQCVHFMRIRNLFYHVGNNTNHPS
eukprot:3268931-Pyramimonas_sp.AAC.1